MNEAFSFVSSNRLFNFSNHMIRNLVDKILNELPERTREIISARLGLETGYTKTLEAIGKSLNITRERVRQLESVGLKQIDKFLAKSYLLDDFFKVVNDHLNCFKGVREEKRLLKELSFLLDVDDEEISKIRFLVFLNKKLLYFAADENHLAFWANDKKFAHKIIEFVKKLNKTIQARKSPLQVESFEKFTREIAKTAGLFGLPNGNLMSYVCLSPAISFSPFGYIGTDKHLEVAPANVGDKAYLVLKTKEQPMHFRDLAGSMNEYAKSASSFHPVWQKTIEAQTVHNELIKNKEFVLVGRGIYALAEWGYQKGTVREVILQVLRKARKPLALEEVVDGVKKHRFVKDSTIFINLQNKKYFEKTKDKKYALKREKRAVEES